MKKVLLWSVVLMLSISMMAAFSLYGCKAEEAPAEAEEGKQVEESAEAEEEAEEAGEEVTEADPASFEGEFISGILTMKFPFLLKISWKHIQMLK